MADAQASRMARFSALEPLIAARSVLAMIEGLDAVGALDQLAAGATADVLAARTGTSVETAAAVLRALEAAHVVEAAADGGFALAAPWRDMRSSAAFTGFADVLAGSRVKAQLLRDAAGSDDYWSISAGDRIAYASSISPDPETGAFAAIMQKNLEAGERFPVALASAGRYLELGCGLAGSGLSTLTVFPTLRMVGVELSDDLADEAERRAAALGVADRFRVVRCDAAEFHDATPFDVGFWSQFFFATPHRAGAMTTLLSHVRSGGVVLAPVRWMDPNDDLADGPRHEYLHHRVLASAWGVPERSPEQLTDELVGAGFSDPEVRRMGPTNFQVTVIRP